VKLWNPADGTVVREFVNPNLKPGAVPPSHPGWVYGVRFLPDGKRLVSVGGAPKNHGSLAVWDVEDGKLLAAEDLPLGAFFSVATTTDGNQLAVGTSGGAGAREVNAYVLKTPAGQ
jgi:WD40 repeat protein